MRLLIIGDIHGNIESFINIISQDFIREIDAILLVGDIGLTMLNRENHLNARLKKLYELSSKIIFQSVNELNIPVLFVPGNWDAKDFKFNFKNIFNIDIIGSGKVCFLDQFAFAGIGGSSYINGSFQYEWTEEETLYKASKILDSTNIRNLVLLSHDSPFYSKIDLNYANIHCGSESIRKIISKYSPIACICGHIHEGVGLDIIGDNTICINAGIIKDNKTYGPNINLNADDKIYIFIEQFFILDLSNLPYTIEHYCVRYDKISVVKTVLNENKLLVPISTGSLYFNTTGNNSFPSKNDYFNKLNNK